ncbi:hypothetical protein CcaverHIS002_0602780 [Cutaneotrichosporon cavernicola]|uniref:2-dehydropantoate 2-reductase n=1 Tax=Cutaneotrichosporon cavernicola TaxID=279322 RepID=A0AA48QXV0_9TREE|nr:uncharacterized protein CcaverHIS019_0602260 [Cutaneotrichosporon cavernicola]BEI85991.1 hypothetical protein CcaverHIS002_0602780 [Cutaneotrichosporon cavernicola]BEI93767.1 hypothetical protein CcaverHIS019_0602260 [Cutaneotrichosporon cavernicola]BEJ01545.1 hypothetical protein CcaverHIS631_0602270 [Cutaneotrichosporon cavernicola]BEJ09309.1 hypothetical protein CcaverHIS641_0602240 [Cutaneotrichosporon cavernicola]
MTNTNTKPRALLFGLGGIGGIYAATLARSGVCEVSVVARSNYEAVKEKGLLLKSEKHGESHHTFAGVYKSPADAATSGPFDYVLCANKALLSAIPSLEETIAPAISQDTAIVLLQNGVGNEVPLHKAFPANTIISAVVWTGGKVEPSLNPTVSQFSRESLTMGVDYTPGIDKAVEDEKVKRLSEILAKANSDSVIVNDIQSARWVKVIWNCAWNALTTVTRLRTNQIFASSPGAEDFSKTLMNEVVAVARAKGLDVPLDTADDLMRQIKEAQGPGLPSSMMMDNEAGRPTEVEVILGTPMREGQRLGVPVPILTTLYTIVRALDWRNAHPDETKFP